MAVEDIKQVQDVIARESKQLVYRRIQKVYMGSVDCSGGLVRVVTEQLPAADMQAVAPCSRNRAFIMRSNISVSLSRINFASSSFESWRV